MRTKSVSKATYKIFLSKSGEFLSAAEYSLAEGNLNAAAGCAAQSAISALDALSAFYLHRVHTGRKHEDAARLMDEEEIANLDGKKKSARQFRKIVRNKTKAEYEERNVFKGEAEDSVKRERRFLNWTKENLPV